MKYWYGGARRFKTFGGFERAAQKMLSQLNPCYLAVHALGARNRDHEILLERNLSNAKKKVSAQIKTGGTFILVPLMPGSFQPPASF